MEWNTDGLDKFFTLFLVKETKTLETHAEFGSIEAEFEYCV